MGVDRERIYNKVAYIREQNIAIKKLLNEKNKEEIITDPWIIKGIKYALQTSVEAVIDIAYHISAKALNHAPKDARDALKALQAGGIISAEEFKVYSGMIGFRNRVVHGYQEISAERIYEIADNELEDFEAFLEKVALYIKST